MCYRKRLKLDFSIFRGIVFQETIASDYFARGQLSLKVLPRVTGKEALSV